MLTTHTPLHRSARQVDSLLQKLFATLAWRNADLEGLDGNESDHEDQRDWQQNDEERHREDEAKEALTKAHR